MAQATEPSSAAPATSDKSRRPGHQIKRSISELAAPGRRHHDNKDRQQHRGDHNDEDGTRERRHHHHHKHHHGSSRKDRRSDAGGDRHSNIFLAPSSGTTSTQLLFGRASAEVPRSEGSSASYFGGSDLDPSRRASLVVPLAPPPLGDPSYFAAIGDGQPTRNSRTKAERDAAVQQERADAMSRAAGLKNALAELSTFSNDTTKTLDDSYYSALERLGTLQQTVVALKELASMSNELAYNFKHDAGELINEIETQVTPFGELDEHQERITSLQGRIGVGREKAKGLSDRVDRVRERVEGWEAADKMWQQRTRKRLKVIWGVIVTATIVMLLLVFLGPHNDKVAASTAAITSSLASASSSVFSSPKATGADIGPDTLGDALLAETNRQHHRGAAVDSLVDEVREALRARSNNEGQGSPDVLRILDEL
ncbi:hypothetical protein Micbo1qcDRAFT_157186 [Microdochium bolleyi]|uniref:Uncharacterized protein n=1 Tax=Microdochium bolleyi TaxID=196109 RepID=A0A136JDY1_9PEZI|nr:hypothetical protein Micbo1qcDRAFT_157186 [Microdochium bolleyi]